MTRKASRAFGLFDFAAWRLYLATRQARAFDRRYGTDTKAKVPVSQMTDADRELARHAVHYEPSAMPKFRRALTVVKRHLGPELSDYNFVDFGSGKGLVVMMASRFSFKAVHGVEMSLRLHEAAQANVRKFADRVRTLAPIHLCCADALGFALPPGNVVAYLYNPFDEELTLRFVDGLIAAADGEARNMMVVYINPVHKSIFERAARFRPVFEDDTLSVYEYASAAAGIGCLA